MGFNKRTFILSCCFLLGELISVPLPAATDDPVFKNGFFRDHHNGISFNLPWSQATLKTGEQVRRELERRTDAPLEPNIEMIAGIYDRTAERYILVWKWVVQTEDLESAWNKWLKDVPQELEHVRLDTRKRRATGMLPKKNGMQGRLLTQWSRDGLFFVGYYAASNELFADYAHIVSSVMVKKKFQSPKFSFGLILIIAIVSGPMVIWGILWMSKKKKSKTSTSHGERHLA